MANWFSVLCEYENSSSHIILVILLHNLIDFYHIYVHVCIQETYENFFHFLFARLVIHNFPPAQTYWLLNFQTSQISKTSTFYLGFGLSDPQPWECPHSKGLHTLFFFSFISFLSGTQIHHYLYVSKSVFMYFVQVSSFTKWKVKYGRLLPYCFRVFNWYILQMTRSIVNRIT